MNLCMRGGGSLSNRKRKRKSRGYSTEKDEVKTLTRGSERKNWEIELKVEFRLQILLSCVG